MKKAREDKVLSSGDLQPAGNKTVSSSERRKSSMKMASNNVTDIKNVSNTSSSSDTRKKPKQNLSNLTLTFADLSLDSGVMLMSPTPPENQINKKSPLIRTPTNNKTPPQLNAPLWHQVLATTPPTGRKKPITPIIPSSSPSTFFPSDFKAGGGKRRNSLPERLDEKSVVKLSQQLDHLFQQFLAAGGNWETTLEDIAEVEIGKF